MAIKIFNPIYITDTYAFISISDWNFAKEKSDEIDVMVMKGDQIAGTGTISKKQWIKTCKQKEKVVKLRPDDPMTFYYNNLVFKQPETEEEKYKRIALSTM
jgi:hypothetical protein